MKPHGRQTTLSATISPKKRKNPTLYWICLLFVQPTVPKQTGIMPLKIKGNLKLQRKKNKNLVRAHVHAHASINCLEIRIN